MTFTFVEQPETVLVIETFVPAFNENDTYLTLFSVERDTSGNVISSSIIADDDNGNPDQTNNKGCSRIEIAGGLPSGTYYIKVHKPTAAGNPNYGIRVVDYDPGTTFPSIVPADEDETSVSIDSVDESVSTRWIPINPQPIVLDQEISRSIFPWDTDKDCFVFTIP